MEFVLNRLIIIIIIIITIIIIIIIKSLFQSPLESAHIHVM